MADGITTLVQGLLDKHSADELFKMALEAGIEVAATSIDADCSHVALAEVYPTAPEFIAALRSGEDHVHGAVLDLASRLDPEAALPVALHFFGTESDNAAEESAAEEEGDWEEDDDDDDDADDGFDDYAEEMWRIACFCAWSVPPR